MKKSFLIKATRFQLPFTRSHMHTTFILPCLVSLNIRDRKTKPLSQTVNEAVKKDLCVPVLLLLV